MYTDRRYNSKADVSTLANSPAFQFSKEGADLNSLTGATFFFCEDEKSKIGFFYVLLTVHLSIILVTDQLNAQILVL